MQMDYAAIMQVMLYTCLFITGLQQLHTAYNSRNKYISIRNGIVALLTLAATLRMVFWCKVCLPGTLDDTFMMVIFFLPVWVNFCGLSLLAVFYAEAVYGGKSEWPMRLCGTGNLVLLVLNVYIAVGMGAQDEEELSERFESSSILYSSSMDFALAVLLFYYGYKFQLMCKDSGNALTTWTPNSVSIFESINWMLIVVYIFRGIAAIVIAAHPSTLGAVEYNGDHAPTRGSVVIFFFITEVLPSFCVILMLWRITGTSRKDLGEASSGLNTRLLSIEDSKVRILVGKESLLENETYAQDRNIFGEPTGNDSSYLLFAPSPIKGGVHGKGLDLGGFHDGEAVDREALLGPDHRLEAGIPLHGTDGANAGTESAVVASGIIDINKYSISAESSFLETNRELFQGPESAGGPDAQAALDVMAGRSSPVVIAKKQSGIAGAGDGRIDASGGVASLESLRLSFGRRGSWSRRENTYISKRTPSPGLSNMVPGEQRLSDADQDNPMLIGSAPGGRSLGSGSGINRHGSYDNLAAAAVSSSIKEGVEGVDVEAAAEGHSSEAEARSPVEKYADTISPRDILLQAQQGEKKKKKKDAGKR